LGAELVGKVVGDLGASLTSYLTLDLGMGINTTTLFHAMDSISFSFNPYKVRNPLFRATDTINISFGPFRGKSLSASIVAELPAKILNARLVATYPAPRVSPATTSLSASDLRPESSSAVEELRFQLEGTLTEFLYVNGTDGSFILDANEKWKINVRSFSAVTAELFGDVASAKICRLGDLNSYFTIDEAVRACIDSVFGLGGESNLGVSIRATGTTVGLKAILGITNNLDDLEGEVFRVFSSPPLGATIIGV